MSHPSRTVAPSFFKVADQNTISKRKKQERIAPLFDKYVSLSLVRAIIANELTDFESMKPDTLLTKTNGDFRN